jgi:hypothetical protein
MRASIIARDKGCAQIIMRVGQVVRAVIIKDEALVLMAIEVGKTEVRLQMLE